MYRRAMRKLLVISALLTVVFAALAFANSQQVTDSAHDSKSGIPRYDITSASVRYDGTRLIFKIVVVKMPQGIHPPCVEIYIGTGVGCDGTAVVTTNTKRFRAKRTLTRTSVTYSFPAAKLRSHLTEVKWRAAIMEGRPADLAPNKGYRRFVLGS